MQLTRSNDDPKLLADLERLAGTSADSDASTVDEFDPFVRRFVQVATHLRRFAPFYAGGALWLLAMVLVQPVGRGGGGATDATDYAASNTSASTPSAAVSDAVVGDVVAAPVPTAAVDAFGLTPVPLAAAPVGEVPSSASTTSTDDPTVEPPPGDGTVVVGSTPLRIVASGYSSQGSGSPYDPFSPKNGGLPVAAAGDRHLRRSYIRLAGTATTLRLRMTTDQQETTPNADAATIKACAITTPNWTAARGQTLDSGPAYSTNCATGTYDGNNVWTFDLSTFPPVESGNGFALVPPAGTSTPFQVTFEPQAVTG